TVTQGQTVTLPDLTMKQGVHLSVRIDDPAGIRAADEGTVPGAHMLTGVRNARGFLLPMSVSRNGNGHDHDMVVPAGAPAQLFVYSKNFAVSDETGKGVDKNAGVSVSVDAAASKAKPVKFTITGRN